MALTSLLPYLFLIYCFILSEVYLSRAMSNDDHEENRRHRHSHGVMDEEKKLVFHDLEVKLANVSSASQFYNVMARYNDEYCDKSLINELEKKSKSSSDVDALQSMKSYCNIVNSRRRLQRRAVRGSQRREDENERIIRLLDKNPRMKTDCQPRKTVVELDPPPGFIYYPKCSLVKRCSGCCNYTNQVCRPIEQLKRTVKRKVIVVDPQPLTKSTVKIKQISLVEHTACECSCNNSASSCSSYQVFDEEECSCKCRHENQSCSEPKRWNQTFCKCECPIQSKCSSGFERDPQYCKCMRRRTANNLTVEKKKKREKSFGKSK